jgi:predicted ATP-binding protein involved in virulence
MRHLVLTGKNGSGKSTILKCLHNKIIAIIKSKSTNLAETASSYNSINNNIEHNIDKTQESVAAFFNFDNHQHEFFRQFYHRNNYIYSYFPAQRVLNMKPITSLINENELVKEINKETFKEKFKFYLVNLKIQQAFEQLKGAKNNAPFIQYISDFFLKIEAILQDLQEDKNLKLEFVSEGYEFFIHLSDGRKITFNELPDGFSAFMFILFDLLIRTDIIRKEKQDFTYNPSGIAIIDEVEVHLHLSLQYQIMPLLTAMFPNVQFIIATHSPAVISSMQNVTVFDLEQQESIQSSMAGKSFSELMLTHFGLEDEYSDIATNLMDKVNTIVKKTSDKTQAKAELRNLLTENKDIFANALHLQLEVEAAILELERA